MLVMICIRWFLVLIALLKIASHFPLVRVSAFVVAVCVCIF